MKSAGDPRSASAVNLSRTSSRARRAAVCSEMIRRCTASVSATNLTSRCSTINASPSRARRCHHDGAAIPIVGPELQDHPDRPAAASSSTKRRGRPGHLATPIRSRAEARRRRAAARPRRCQRCGPSAPARPAPHRRRAPRWRPRRTRRVRAPRARREGSRGRPDDPSGFFVTSRRSAIGQSTSALSQLISDSLGDAGRTVRPRRPVHFLEGDPMTDTLTSTPVVRLPGAAAEARVRADDRGHVFHSWSAQASSILFRSPGAKAPLLGLRGQLLPRLLVAAGQSQPGASASGSRRSDPASRPVVSRRSSRRWRTTSAASSPAGSPRSRPKASRRSSSPTAAPTRTRTPCAWRAS